MRDFDNDYREKVKKVSELLGVDERVANKVIEVYFNEPYELSFDGIFNKINNGWIGEIEHLLKGKVKNESRARKPIQKTW